MQTNLILDQNLQPGKVLTPQEVLVNLQKHGFYQAYETIKGEVKISGLSPLKCQITQTKDGSWIVDVSAEWLSAYSIIPAVILKFLFLMVGLNGVIILAVCGGFGIAIANGMLSDKKEQLLTRLEASLSE